MFKSKVCIYKNINWLFQKRVKGAPSAFTSTQEVALGFQKAAAPWLSSLQVSTGPRSLLCGEAQRKPQESVAKQLVLASVSRSHGLRFFSFYPQGNQTPESP